jgi:hypothetical protein
VVPTSLSCLSHAGYTPCCQCVDLRSHSQASTAPIHVPGQVRGESSSGGLGFGKLWTVSEMVAPRILDETFIAEDPNYNPDDSAMKRICCCVAGPGAAAS